MKISISKENIVKALEIVIGATKVNNIKPIMACVLLQVEKKKLVMVSTDYEIEITTNCEAEADASFKQALNAAKLLSICRSFESETQITIEFKDNTATLKANNSTFNLVNADPEDFILLSKSNAKKEEFSTLSGEELISGLRSVNYASSQQSHRIALNGVLVESEAEQINFVATDGHRMAVKSLKTSEKADIRRILPRRSVDILLQQIRSDDEVQILVVDKMIQIKTARFEFTSNIIEENYPDYLSVIPRNNDKKVVIERQKLLSAVRRGVLLSEKKVTVIMTLTENKLEIKCVNKENEVLEEWMPVNYKQEELIVGFDASFLIDVLNVLEDEMIEFSFSDTRSGVLIKPIDESNLFLYVVMPIRINQPN